MTHDEAFLRDVIEAPDDDGPRLIYADWLEDEGRTERAELIRAQCELARIAAEGPRRTELEATARALLAEHGREWAGPLRSWASEWEFHSKAKGKP